MADDVVPTGGVPAALAAFGADLVDYAGLFPPSKLPMEQAVPNFLAYLAGDRAPLLGRFIVPVGRLDELAPFAEAIEAAAGDGSRIRFAVLPRGGDDEAAFAATFAEDLARIARFEADLHGKANVDTLEMRLPASLASRLVTESAADASGAAADLRGWIGSLIEQVVAGVPQPGAVSLFVELPYSEANAAAWRYHGIRTLIEAVGSHDSLPRAVANLGVKVRCGGTAPPPSIDDLLAAIASATEQTVALKYTAGLHHALPAADRPGYPHGYVNVFAATIVASAAGYDADRTRAILADTDPASFRFSGDQLQWRDIVVPLDALRHKRDLAALSFGSCDFIEPTSELLAWA